MINNDGQHLVVVLRHIDSVKDNCLLLSNRMIESKTTHTYEFITKLISNGYSHDASKLIGIEWEYLRENIKEKDEGLFNLAMKAHYHNNQHHPEYWEGINNMPSVYIAEMVCDWKARSGEFGTDLREWVKEKATKRWNFTTQGRVYKEIKEYLDLLLDPRFT